ncbi:MULTISPECIES: ParB N-terminal domain-containing protein [Bradyrhizobium]|uniref:plasmid stabilization protein n=1 Tax=Bradyrhizobium TaxID=374 RepID=UPI00235BE2EE|nr:plasmid stabilization protein [Bradyrhizobium liaoningense]WLB86606.1 plasmid stabilization protein [Bradyrhizobium japonicum USDA 135]GLR93102.1 hypothetical protein GCM10007858_07250 [Bradyrhizobium liaoningense]
MTKVARKFTQSSSRDIPSCKPVVGQWNVRPLRSAIFIEQFAKTITRRSLPQSLNLRPIVEVEVDETGMFEVPADGIRCRALGLLTKQKQMAKVQAAPFVAREGGLGGNEIIFWRLRMYVLADVSGIEIRLIVVDSYPLVPIGDREAA